MPLTKIPESPLAGESIAAGATSSYGATIDLTQAVQLSLSANVTYAGSGVTQPCLLQVFASIDGGVFDNYPFQQISIPVPDGGGISRLSINVNSSPNYIRCNILNPDPTLGVTVAQIKSVKQVAT